MFGTQRPWLAWVASGVLLLAASGARAIYLDEDQNITLRARIYSQAAVRIQNSSVDTEPTTFAGQLVQQRNFFNPELDAKLTSYMNWMRGGWLNWATPDDLRFRIAAWGFYDGIYDYGSAQFNRSQKIINSSFNNGVACGNDPNPTRPCAQNKPGGWFIRGPNFKLIAGANPGGTFNDVFPGYELYEARDIYANQARVNELYLSYTKGPFFLRVGKQSISWGESDTIALLDQSNPFDLTLAAPGFFEDVDEARIPLYTVRASYNLFDVLGPLSSGFVEGYWVPGDLDATTPIVPELTVSPYSPRGVDPQLQGGSPADRVFPPQFQFVFFDHIPKQNMGSSRYGFRFQTVINRFLTLQTWMYRTFPIAPVPQHLGFAGNTPPPIMINNTSFYIISLEHKPVMVYGVAGTFFLEALDGIVRMNAQFFEHEAGFIPRKNLNICAISPTQPQTCQKSIITANGTIPYANILRWEVGFDRFFFLRFLNPTNSFVAVVSAVGAWNTSRGNDVATDQFRFNGQLKPSAFQENAMGQIVPRARGRFIDDFVNAETVSAQFQATLQTDYMHGRLTPRATFIQFTRGTFAFHPTLTYRWNDWLLFQADYQYITGAYQSLGFFRDRDQVSVRVTYQLN